MIIMLKQIELEEALKLYISGQKDIKILRHSPKNEHMVMYSFDELFKDAICLAEDNIKVDAESNENSQTEHLISEIFEFEEDNQDPKSKVKKSNNRRSRLDIAKMRALYDAGWSAKAISEELNCSLAVVYKYIKGWKK